MENSPANPLESLRSFIQAAEQGAAIPPVDERDLKALHELCVERARRYVGKDGVLSLELMVKVVSPEANLSAVWLRHTQLRGLYREGLLAEWQKGTVLNDAVFKLAATIPIVGTNLDREAFLQELRIATAA